MDDVIQLTDKEFLSVTWEGWVHICNHMKWTEAECMNNESQIDAGHEIVIYVWGTDIADKSGRENKCFGSN
jgi:hypothetical protein